MGQSLINELSSKCLLLLHKFDFQDYNSLDCLISRPQWVEHSGVMVIVWASIVVDMGIS
jgi:hypothetical protein